MPVTRDAVIWGFRLILGREAESEAVIQQHMGATNLSAFSQSLFLTDEFRSRLGILSSGNGDVAGPAEGAANADRAARARVPQSRRALDAGVLELAIDELPLACFLDEGAKRLQGVVRVPRGLERDLARLRLGTHDGERREGHGGIELQFGSIPRAQILIGASNQRLAFGSGCEGEWFFRLWGECSVEIGNGTSALGVECYVGDGGRLAIGNDCLIDRASLHVGDRHCVFELDTLSRIGHRERPEIVIQDHVRIAAGALVRADSLVGAGAIVAAGTVIEGNVPGCVVIAGSPPAIVRRDVSWTRDPAGKGAADVAKYLAEDEMATLARQIDPGSRPSG
ncbi:MAG: hypothetical protein AB7P21_23910 [Lautropia sp.]